MNIRKQGVVVILFSVSFLIREHEAVRFASADFCCVIYPHLTLDNVALLILLFYEAWLRNKFREYILHTTFMLLCTRYQIIFSTPVSQCNTLLIIILMYSRNFYFQQTTRLWYDSVVMSEALIPSVLFKGTNYQKLIKAGYACLDMSAPEEYWRKNF
uniref:Uncharacterized protein n=1 Tax=Trichobilharzia regenti TaxID=157069 RepID=A0AA85JUK7_TRIRE|nr:unnamed protein product [Trichobilharzia regenti]